MDCDGDPDEIQQGRKSFPSGHSSCELQYLLSKVGCVKELNAPYHM